MTHANLPNGARVLSRSKGGKDAGSAGAVGALIPDSFDPEARTAIVAAYDSTVQELGLTGRSDLITEVVARKIIELRKPESAIPNGSGLWSSPLLAYSDENFMTRA